jgi:O-antigen/teichoic acid export membrane protein
MSKTISLKKNVIFNTSGQIYTTLIALIMLPLYIKYMGAEAYGLIGFFSIIQSIFAILDF